MRTLLTICVVGLAVALAVPVARSCAVSASPTAEDKSGVDLPEGDPLLQAIQKRFGRPDRVTGSGRMFIHYDLENGDTLTLIVSGGKVIGIEHTPKK